MKPSIAAVLLCGLLSPAVGAETLCYFLVAPDGSVTSYRQPPYDLSYPQNQGLSSGERAKRQKGHLVIAYTTAQCGTIEEVVIDNPDDINAILTKVGAKMSGSEPLPGMTAPQPVTPPPPPPPAKTAQAAPEKLTGTETSVNAQSMTRVATLLQDGIQKRNLSALEPYLSNPVIWAEDRGSGPVSKEYTPADFIVYLSSQWQELQTYELRHTDVRLEVEPSGKIGRENSELVVVSQGQDAASRQETAFRESVTYTLSDGLTKISKIERWLKNPPPAPEPAEAPPASTAPATPSGNIAETAKP